MITEKQALEIAREVDPMYDYQPDDAYFPINFSEFTRALNLAAAMALENLGVADAYQELTMKQNYTAKQRREK